MQHSTGKSSPSPPPMGWIGRFSCSVVPDSLRPHELQHARHLCPSPTPGVHSNSHPSSHWCHPAISSSVVPFSSCPQSLPASESFPMSQLFAWGGQSTGVSALASFLPKNTQGWSPLEWTCWISLQSKGLKSLLQHHSSKASILWCSAFFTAQLSHPHMTTGKTIALTRQTFVGKVMSLLLNMLSRLVITSLPRSKHLFILWLQSPSTVILEPQQIKSDTVSTVTPSISREVMAPQKICPQSSSRRKVAQSCPTLCGPMDCSLPGSSINGIFQARVLEWVAISFEGYLIWRKGLCTWSWVKDLEIKRHPRLFWKTLNPVTSILMRHMREREEETNTEEKATGGVRQRLEWCSHQPRKLRNTDSTRSWRRQGSLLLQHLQREWGPPTTWVWISGLPYCERLDSCPFKPPISW